MKLLQRGDNGATQGMMELDGEKDGAREGILRARQEMMELESEK